MGKSWVSWMCSAVAPWCLAAGLVVSFTAEAGQDAPIGASRQPRTSHGPSMPDDLVPQTRSLLAGRLLGHTPLDQPAVQLASLAYGVQGEADGVNDEIAPRINLKRYVRSGSDGHAAMPEVERSNRGDPLVTLRPAFDAKLRRDPGLQHLRMGSLVFGAEEGAVTSAFVPHDGDAQGLDAAARFEPWPDGESPTTTSTRADSSPRTTSSTDIGTPQPAVRDGATPAVPRAVALSSATPVTLQAMPVEVLALAAQVRPDPNATIVPRASQPDFAALLDPAQTAKEKKCLAEAIYFEARSESEAGQAAVAQVVLNRVNSGLYPSTVCGVVYQNRTHYNACQFSFACEGKSLRINEPEPWATAVRIAEAVTSGQTYSVGVGSATHYHANYVRPRWARQLKKMDVIGTHVFYRLRGSQS